MIFNIFNLKSETKDNYIHSSLILLLLLALNYPKMNHAFFASKTRMQSALYALQPRDYEKVLRVAQDAAYKAGKIMR